MRDVLQKRLDQYWARLPEAVRVLSCWTPSKRFPELTYIREELLGSYKARKYLSLIPWLKSQEMRRVRISGSSHSGNVAQLALLLRAEEIEPFYVMEGRGGPDVGNALLAKLAYGSNFKVEQSEQDWDFTIPEGGSCPASLAGSLGLAGSLVERALEADRWGDKLYVDSGTGFSAVALLLGLGFFDWSNTVTIVSMTGQTRSEILAQIELLSTEFERLMGESPRIPEFVVCAPPVGPSFGSVPASSLAEVQRFAREESIFVDPIYTAKLSLAYQEMRKTDETALMFISGGARELLCFQGPLRKWLGS